MKHVLVPFNFDEPIYFVSLYVITWFVSFYLLHLALFFPLLFHPVVALEINYYIQAEILIRWGYDMRWTWRSEYIRELSAGVSGTQADRLTHLSTEDRRFPHLCKLKSSREGFERMENALNYFYTHAHSHLPLYGNRDTQYKLETIFL